MKQFKTYEGFKEAVQKNLAKFNPGRPGYFPRFKKYYPHIIDVPAKASKKQKENIVKCIIRDDSVAPDLFTSSHMYAHHLNSSQVVCYEFFRPLITAERKLSPEMLKCLAQIGIPAEMFADGLAEFEYVPDSAENTNFDFFIGAPQTGAKAYFEIKYTEQGFGTCDNDKKHEEKFNTIYEGMIDNCVCLKKKPSFDAAWRKNYQLFRNVLRLTKSNWRDEYVIFLFPEENVAAKKHFDAFVEEFIDSAYKSHIIEAHWEDMKPMSDRFRDKFFFYKK